METLDSFIRRYGYAAIFLGVMGEQFAPVPGEPFLLAAGALAGTGRLEIGLTVTLALLGAVVGDVIWYELGRRGGHRVLRWLCRMSIEPDSCVRRSEDLLSRRGAGALLVAKFVPGLHSIAQPLAGALGMRRGPFFVFDVVGALFWVGLYVGLGYAFHDELTRAAVLARQLGTGAPVALSGAFAAYLAVKVVRRQWFLRQLRIARISPEELKAKLDHADPVFVVDLRHALDVRADPTGIPGALHMELSELEEREAPPAGIPRGREVVLYCS
jgi:membrane protein DedA with SNARE-associated domain